jgi:hypothetical protein
MAGPGRQRHELLELLDEQLDFLNASARQFDSGVLHEYKRIALVVRVLLHDTASSHSLLAQLGVKDTLLFEDTRREPQVPPGAIVLTAHDWPSGMVMVRTRLGDESPARFAPMPDKDPETPTTQRAFESWWRDPILELRSGETFCRWDFINGIANKEGVVGAAPRPGLGRSRLGGECPRASCSDSPLGPGRRPPDRV